ncbi:unannotated protein [freshwater metagenome]|uniref:Unannotated protein n=1 Tax=freshwater metagenome TaxID=449393 RepID=A0A6J7AW73_9ZZZZ
MYPELSKKNPDPVPPESPLRTSIETTEGETLAAIPAIESGLRSITLFVVTKLVFESIFAVVRPATLPTTPAISAIVIATPKPTVLVFRFLISWAVTTGCSEIHQGVSGVLVMIKFYGRQGRLRQLEVPLHSIWNLHELLLSNRAGRWFQNLVALGLRPCHRQVHYQ